MQKNQILLPLFFLFALPSLALTSPLGIQENLDLRRIAEYWKEGDFEVVKSQINDFLSYHPDSTYRDHLFAMLGDLYFKEKNFVDALSAYEQIREKEFQEKTLFSKTHSHYSLHDYQATISSASLFLKRSKGSKQIENTVRFELADSYYQLGRQESQKDELFKQALNHYRVLSSTDQADCCLYPLAEIHTYFKDYREAAAIYLQLSQKNSPDTETLLFQAATLQVQVDKKAAAATFGKIYPLQGSKASLAAFNQLTLLFQEKCYKELLLAEEKASKYISPKNAPLVDYYIGKSLIACGDYRLAIPSLKIFLESDVSDPVRKKNTLLALSICAKETQNGDLFESSLQQLKSGFSADEELSKALLLHAQFCKETRNLPAAERDFQELIALFPAHPQREAILYDYALLLTQQRNADLASSAFEQFLIEFPLSPRAENAWRHRILSLIESSKKTPLTTEKIKKEELATVLSEALKKAQIFAHAEKKQIRYLLGKTLYEIGKYDESLLALQDYIQDYPKDPSCKLAYLLIADCYLKGSNDKLLFTVNAEKALDANVHLQDKETLHLQLYNAYLVLAAKEVEEGKADLILKAADHLFKAQDLPIKRENHLWLANYYYHKLPHAPAELKAFYLTRATLVLEKLLSSKKISDMEGEAIKLSELYTQAGKYKEKADLLETLRKEQEQAPDRSWKYQRFVLFELAKSHELLGNIEKALEGYSFLIESAAPTSSYFATAAQLQKTLLEYAQMKDSTSVQKTLDQLKTLSIQRKLVSEPIHLEAALYYVTIKSSSKQASLSALNHLKASLQDEKDPVVQQYFGVKGEFPDKLKLFEQYMQLISAQELRLQGAIALEQEEKQRAEEFFLGSKMQLEPLLQGQLHPSLERRVKLMQEQIP